MRTNFNEVHIEGYLYGTGTNDRNKLAMKEVTSTTSPRYGQKYIGGTIQIAVDEAMTNVISVEFPFVTPVFSKSKNPSPTYEALARIIAAGEDALASKSGIEGCLKVSIDRSSLALNDYYDPRNDTMVSIPITSGGFVNIINDLNPDVSKRHEFHADVLFTRVTPVEADEEKNILQPYDKLRGCVFTSFGTPKIMPYNFAVRSEGGMAYFENHDFTTDGPLYVEVWGEINNTVTYTTTTTETAFGGDVVTQVPHYSREWCVTRAKGVPYDFGEENVMTEADFMAMQQAREVELAEKKEQRLARDNAKNAPAAAAPSGFTAKPGAFNFANY